MAATCTENGRSVEYWYCTECKRCYGDSDPQKEVEKGELAESVNRVLSSLSPEIRDVFTARYFYAASLYEISKRTGFSIGKIKSMLHRTRKKLQSELKEEGLC